MDQKAYFEMSESDRRIYDAQQSIYGGELSMPSNVSSFRAAYKAGSEYMRQECIKKVYGWCESDNVAARTVEAIRKIEA